MASSEVCISGPPDISKDGNVKLISSPPVIFAGLASPSCEEYTKRMGKKIKRNKPKAMLRTQFRLKSSLSKKCDRKRLYGTPKNMLKELQMRKNRNVGTAFHHNRDLGSTNDKSLMNVSNKLIEGTLSCDEISLQIEAILAALDHSKAREALLSEKVSALKEQVADQSLKIVEKQHLLDTLEEDYRRMKSNFRDLVTVAIESNPRHEKESRLPHPEDPCISDREGTCVSVKKETHHDDNDAVQDDEGKKEYDVAYSDATTFQSSCRHEKEARSRSVPRRLEEEVEGDVGLSCGTRDPSKPEELVESLRETNTFAKDLLQRNSELEEKCRDLAESHRLEMQNLLDNLNAMKSDKTEMSSTIHFMTKNISFYEEELEALHEELRLLHERDNLHIQITRDYECLQDRYGLLEKEYNQYKKEAEQEKNRLINEKDLKSSEIEILKARTEVASGIATEDSSYVSNLESLDLVLLTERNEFQKKIDEASKTIADLKLEKEKEVLRSDTILQEKEQLELKLQKLEDRNAAQQKTIETYESEISTLTDQLANLEREAASLSGFKEELDFQRAVSKHQNDEIERQLNVIKELNERIVIYADQETVLNKILQQKQNEQETMLSGRIELSECLSQKMDLYRKLLEDINKENASLKKALDEKESSLKLRFETVRMECFREFKEVQKKSSEESSERINTLANQLREMKAKHKFEIQQIRREKDEKIEKISVEYESWFNELKQAQNERLKDFETNRDSYIEILRKDYEKRICHIESEIQDNWMKEKKIFESTVFEIEEFWQNELKKQLKGKTEEIRKLKNDYNELCSKDEAEIAVLKNEIVTLKKQLVSYNEMLKSCKLRGSYLAEKNVTLKRMQSSDIGNVCEPSENDTESTTDACSPDNDRADIHISDLEARHKEEIHNLKLSNSYSILLLERQIKSHQEREQKLLKEINHLNAALTAKEEQENCTIVNYERRLKEAMDQKNSEIQELLCKSTEDRNMYVEQIKELQDSVVDQGSSQDTSSLNEEIEILRGMNAELIEVSRKQAEEFKRKVQERDETLQSIIKNNSLVPSLVEKNAELERKYTAEKQCRISDEASFLRQLTEKERELIELRASLKELQHKKNMLSEKLSCHTELVEDVKSHQKRADILMNENEKAKCTIAELKREIINYKELVDKLEQRGEVAGNAQISELSEAVQVLKKELVLAKEKIFRYNKEVEDLRMQLFEKNKYILELNVDSCDIDSQRSMAESLKQTLDEKQKIISDLLGKLSSVSSEKSSDAGTKEERDNLRKRCIELDENCRRLEKETKNLMNRLKLEKEILGNNIEQQNRQLEQLLKTNKRAEQLLQRNFELEQHIVTLTSQLQYSKSHPSTDPNCYGVLENCESTSNVSLDMLQKEIESLRKDLGEKELTIRDLENRLSDMELSHQEEVADWRNRLRMVTTKSNMLQQQKRDVSTRSSRIQVLLEKVNAVKVEVEKLNIEGNEEKDEFPDKNSSESSHITQVEGLKEALESLKSDKALLEQQIASISSKGTLTERLDSEEVIQSKKLQLSQIIMDLLSYIKAQRDTIEKVNVYSSFIYDINTNLQIFAMKLRNTTEGEYAVDIQMVENIMKQNMELRKFLDKVSEEDNSEIDTNVIMENQILSSIQQRLIEVKDHVEDLSSRNSELLNPSENIGSPRASVSRETTVSPGTIQRAESVESLSSSRTPLVSVTTETTVGTATSFSTEILLSEPLESYSSRNLVMRRTEEETRSTGIHRERTSNYKRHKKNRKG